MVRQEMEKRKEKGESGLSESKVRDRVSKESLKGGVRKEERSRKKR